MRRRVHPKVVGATLGGALAGLVIAVLERRCGVRLLPEEITVLQLVGAFAGGYLKRYVPE